MFRTLPRFLIGISLLSIPFSGISQKLPILHLEDAFKEQETIYADEFINSVKYVALETTPDCLIGANPKITPTEKYFIITDNQDHCYLFDRNTGKFIREIGHYGKDPGGFRNNKGFYNEITSTIYFYGWKGNLLKYSLEGKYLGSVSIPYFNDGFTNAYIPDSFEYLENDLIVCNIINTNGLQKTLLLIFDENGKEVKSIPNRKPLIEHNLTISVGDIKFFHYKDNLYFNEFCDDTIWQVSSYGSLPYMLLDRGKLIPTRENIGQNKVTGIIQTRSFFESEKFFLITLWVKGSDFNLAFYNKNASRLKVCTFTTGFKNNIDGFVSFLPKAICNEELIGIIQQHEISLWSEKNSVLKAKLPKSLYELTQKDPTDNPIIAIAKLK